MIGWEIVRLRGLAGSRGAGRQEARAGRRAEGGLAQRHAASLCRCPISLHTSRSAATSWSIAVVVQRRGRDAQALGAARHGRVVDRLDVDAVPLEQQVARRLAAHRVADQHRHDVRRAAASPAARPRPAAPLQRRRPLLLARRAAPRPPGRAASAHRWPAPPPTTAGGREVVKMKPGAWLRTASTSAADAGDVAAHAAERLAERPLDHVDLGHDAVALGDAAPCGAVHARPRAPRRGRSGRRSAGPASQTVGDRAEIAVHRVDALERDQLRPRRGCAASSCSRWSRSLWRKICFSQPARADARRSSRRGCARPTGSGSPAAAGRWCRSPPRWRRSPR